MNPSWRNGWGSENRFQIEGKILLKGGKESLLSNQKIVSLLHQAPTDTDIDTLGGSELW
jgi:hypothetical protein